MFNYIQLYFPPSGTLYAVTWSLELVWIPGFPRFSYKQCKTFLFSKFRVTGHLAKDEDILNSLLDLSALNTK